jgi:ABC-type transport system involved in multi-copper enzyme maturation permease subunit
MIHFSDQEITFYKGDYTIEVKRMSHSLEDIYLTLLSEPDKGGRLKNKMSEIEINRDTGTEKKIKYKEPFSFANVKRIFLKDWMEIRHNKELLFPIIFLPVIFSVGMPFLSGIGAIADLAEIGVSTVYEAINMMVNVMLKPTYLLIPTVVSMIIASDSFAGEKERKTAETLLVLPISHKELYLGKLLAALIPAIVFEILSFVIMGIEINLIALPHTLPGEPLFVFGDLSFWLVAFLLGTLFSTVSVQLGIMISARSKNYKSAQSISGIIIVPILGLMFGSMVNPFLLSDIGFILLLGAILTVIVYIQVIIGSKLISKERLVANIG